MTHQRQVLYEVMQGMEGHPSPEEVYARVKKKVPSISMATVYKNIHLFVESGVLREVSLHHGSQRVEMNREEYRPETHRVRDGHPEAVREAGLTGSADLLCD